MNWRTEERGGQRERIIFRVACNEEESGAAAHPRIMEMRSAFAADSGESKVPVHNT